MSNINKYEVTQTTSTLTQVDGTAYGCYYGYGVVTKRSTLRTIMFPSHSDAQAMCDELNTLEEENARLKSEIENLCKAGDAVCSSVYKSRYAGYGGSEYEPTNEFEVEDAYNQLDECCRVWVETKRNIKND